MNSWLCLYRALLLGGCLGIIYGFLRPMRPRWLGDLLFLGALYWVWIYLVFGLCNADPRFAYTATLLGGCFLWDQTFGFLLLPVFSAFWKGFYRLMGVIALPLRLFLSQYSRGPREKNAIILCDYISERLDG